MQISNYNLYQYQNNQNLNFKGIRNFNLSYVIKERSHLVPQRMIEVIKDVLKSKPAQEPTLRDLHLKTYAPLLECKNLDEARNLFPEFREVLDAVIFENSPSKNIKELKKHIELKDLSLKLLQDTWAKLKTQDEIAQELGLANRQKLDWFKNKINFVNKDKNYNPLLKVSDPVLKQEVAAKTTAYNLAHPEQMMARNKKAAQACKKPENRAKQRERSRQIYINHPELREQVRFLSQETWDRLPHIKEQMREFSQTCPDYTRAVIKKGIQGYELSPKEERIRKKFYKDFWEAHPQAKQEYQEMRKLIAEEIKKQ